MFKEWDKFIENNKSNMIEFEIYYNLKINNDLDFDGLNDDDVNDFIDLIKSAYLHDEQHLDLSYICDKLVENADKILNGNWTKWDLLEVCYE